MLPVTVSTFVFFLTPDSIYKASRVVWNHLVEAVSNMRAASKEVVFLQACTTRIHSEPLVVVSGRLYSVSELGAPLETRLFLSSLFRSGDSWPEPTVWLVTISWIVNLFLQVNKAGAFISIKSRLRLSLEHILNLVIGSRCSEKTTGGATSPTLDHEFISTCLFLYIVSLKDSHHLLPSTDI